MNACVGRVGGLAVALGIGAALLTGTATAWADPDTSSNPSSGSAAEAGSGSVPKAGGKIAADKKGADTKAAVRKSADKKGAGTKAAVQKVPERSRVSSTADPDRAVEKTEKTEAAEVAGDAVSKDARSSKPVRKVIASKPASDPQPARPPVRSKQATEVTDEADDRSAADPDAVRSPSVRTVAPPAASVASLSMPSTSSVRPRSTASDPTTAVGYVTDIVSSLASAVVSPFTAGLPAGPVEPPTGWTLLAWVRRELFNDSPKITYDPAQNTQSLNADGDVVVTGRIEVADADGDPHSYAVVGRPHNGGVVDIDDQGNFTYRPMNAMAAVGGEDWFSVVVSDEEAGPHVHGPLGLLQFVPILGDLINPGAGHRTAQTIRVTVAPTAGIDLSLPDDFLWGVAHSGFQAEGGPGSPVDPNSDWYRWVHDPVNQLFGLTDGVPENGPGSYLMFDSDAQLARDELGMNTFRMGIEWSRIFPSSTASVDISDEGGAVSLADLQALDALADPDEVEHYRAVLESLRAHGLEPLVTVNHFTLPVWVHDPITARPLIQLGLPAPAPGWLSPTTAVEFEKYAAYLAWKYGGQVDNWATLNEPFPPVLTEFFAIPGLVPSWPPGVIRPDLASTFLVNQARGHVAAYDAIHAWDTVVATPGQPAAFVGFTNNMIPARPANPASLLDTQAADAWNRYYNHWFPNAVVDGWVDANFDGIKTPDEVHPDFVDKVDWLGVQYYGSQPMQGIGVAPVPGFPFLQGLPIRCAAESPTCSDFNQPTDPGGFREVLEVAAGYGKPLWVTENGIADDDDTKRPSYLVSHIAVVQDMVAHGTDIRGYTYWSFVDNLEWADGYHLQFGLYGSDPTTLQLERTPKPDSIAAISRITRTNGLPLALLATYVPQWL